MTPEETAQWALRVSIASAALSVIGVIWQVALYRLSGARLAVELHSGRLDSYDTLTRGPGNHSRRPLRWNDRGGPAIDVAIITVTNIGRSAVSVRDIGLHLGRIRNGIRWHALSASGIPIAVHEGASTNAGRLDTGSSIVVILDVQSVILQRRRERYPKPVYVRAVATPSGRRKRRSSLRRRWKIAPEQLSIWDDVVVDDEARLYHAVSTAARRNKAGVMTTWATSRKYLADNTEPDYGEFVDALEARGIEENAAANIAMEIILHLDEANTAAVATPEEDDSDE